MVAASSSSSGSFLMVTASFSWAVTLVGALVGVLASSASSSLDDNTENSELAGLSGKRDWVKRFFLTS